MRHFAPSPFLPFTLALACFAAALPALADDYPIKLDRTAKVGDELLFKGDGTDTMKQEVWVGIQKLQQETKTLKAEIEADMKVLGVGLLGKPAWMRFTIKRYKGEIDGKPVDGPGPGSVIEIKRGKEHADISLQDGTISEETRKLLAMILPDPKDADMKDDAALGTRDRKRPGDEWTVNPPGVAENTAAAGIKMDPKDINGTVKLVEVKSGPAGQTIVVQTKLSMVNVPLPVPAATRATQATISSETTWEIPLDPKLPRLTESSKMQLKATVIMPSMEGPTREMLMDNVREEHQWTMPKPPEK